MATGRALHYVFKVADRNATAFFYRTILGMKVLRHEEFTEGCEAKCNGPYANRWSKTMVGYGPEDDHFVIELTYNYGVTSYIKGNDFIGITIKSQEAIKRAEENKWPMCDENGMKTIESPGGYKFFLIDAPQPIESDPVIQVSIACSNIKKSILYWTELLGLKTFEEKPTTVLLGFDDNQAKLEIVQIDEEINRATAYGRIAFSCPYDMQESISSKIKSSNQVILTPLISLDTPGKATVRVIILGDPDGHEICFVDDEGFRELSKVDPEGDNLLSRYIQLDKSRE